MLQPVRKYVSYLTTDEIAHALFRAERDLLTTNQHRNPKSFEVRQAVVRDLKEELARRQSTLFPNP